MLPPLTLAGWLRFDLVRRRLSGLHVDSVLEIGPGVGALGVRLAQRYRYTGVEMDAESAQVARERLARTKRGRIVHGSIAELGDETFDLVCAFEVLEHIEDDEAALSTWRRLLAPGGLLALSVPAWPRLWGAHDVAAGHYRRYERAQLLDLLRSAGYSRAEALSYGFPLTALLHPFWNLHSARATTPSATIEARTHASGRFRQPPTWLGPVTQAASAPFRLLQRPFVQTSRGTGFVAFAQNARRT